MKINETHFAPISEFQLSWRFTQDSHNNLSSKELSKIHPLNKAAAAHLHRQGLSMVTQEEHGYRHDKTVFSAPQELDTTAISEDEVRDWLYSRLSIPNETIFLSWSQEVAALTDVGTFLKYWDDFCYPSSDDVFIFPDSQKWLLLYWHSERFSWGIKHS